jgi:Domain of unknown function (DUF6285)
MHDRPPPELLIAEARKAKQAGLAPGFARKVADNALAIASRELALGPGQDAGEMERLAVLVGAEGDLAARNHRLAQAIRLGELDGTDPLLLAHLIATTIAKLEVDQPAYPAFARWRDER